MIAVLHVAICDDEDRSLGLTELLVKKCPNAQIAGAFSNGQDLLDALEVCRPNVALIDVEMPGLSGFDTAEKLADRDWVRFPDAPLIMFITDDPNFGIVAFDCGAVGILNKPVRLTRLRRCLESAQIAMARHETRQRLARLGGTLDQVRRLYRRARASSHIIVRRWGHPPIKIPLSSIEWIEADRSSHVLLHCGSEVYRKYAFLKGMTEELAGAGFMRIHLSTLVNTRAIVRVESGAGVTAVRVRSGERLSVSRPYRPNAQALTKWSLPRSQR